MRICEFLGDNHYSWESMINESAIKISQETIIFLNLNLNNEID